MFSQHEIIQENFSKHETSLQTDHRVRLLMLLASFTTAIINSSLLHYICFHYIIHGSVERLINPKTKGRLNQMQLTVIWKSIIIV